MKTLNGIGVKLQASSWSSGRVQMGSVGTAPPWAHCASALFAFVSQRRDAEGRRGQPKKQAHYADRTHPARYKYGRQQQRGDG